MNWKKALVFVVVVLVAVLIVGFIGGQIVSNDVGLTCDFGTEKAFCLWWHQNVIGDFRDAAEDIGKAFEDTFGK